MGACPPALLQRFARDMRRAASRSRRQGFTNLDTLDTGVRTWKDPSVHRAMGRKKRERKEKKKRKKERKKEKKKEGKKKEAKSKFSLFI